MINQESSGPILLLGPDFQHWLIFQEAGPKMYELVSNAGSKMGEKAREQHESADMS